MVNVERFSRIHEAKQHLRNHFVSSVVAGAGIVGVGSGINYWNEGIFVDNASSDPVYVAGQQAQSDAEHAFKIKNSYVKNLPQLKKDLLTSHSVLTNSNQYREIALQVEKNQDRRDKSIFGGIFTLFVGHLIYTVELERKEKKEQSNATL